MENVFYHIVSDLVILFPQTSAAAVAFLTQRGISAGIAHIDGASDYQTVLSEAEAYWPLIEPGGHLVGDDYNETWPSAT